MRFDAPRVAVLGAGSWGTALAALLARNEVPTTLWGRDGEAIAAMAANRENARFLPGIALPSALDFSADLAATVGAADLLCVVTPSHAFPGLLRQLAPLRLAHAGLVWATKGFEPGSGRFLHQVAADILGHQVPLAAITGPSFAKEVAIGLPTAVTVHSTDAAFATRVASLLHAPAFRAYTGTDMIGAGIGGAVKNVLAVATGVADGMELGLNARAGLITRGLNEMLRLNAALGGRPETLMGLAGLGDLVLTCTGDLSRNRRLGLLLGQGVALDEAQARIGQVVEGVQTAEAVMRLVRTTGLDLPITEHVYRVLAGDMTPADGLRALLAREPKPEFE
jgi:glycerol-3-phosphate dehydrogenase (NAD(P)+)